VPRSPAQYRAEYLRRQQLHPGETPRQAAGHLKGRERVTPPGRAALLEAIKHPETHAAMIDKWGSRLSALMRTREGASWNLRREIGQRLGLAPERLASVAGERLARLAEGAGLAAPVTGIPVLALEPPVAGDPQFSVRHAYRTLADAKYDWSFVNSDVRNFAFLSRYDGNWRGHVARDSAFNLLQGMAEWFRSAGYARTALRAA
jgi:hypothetical protein